jgi:hypothetical protein
MASITGEAAISRSSDESQGVGATLSSTGHSRYYIEASLSKRAGLIKES